MGYRRYVALAIGLSCLPSGMGSAQAAVFAEGDQCQDTQDADDVMLLHAKREIKALDHMRLTTKSKAALGLKQLTEQRHPLCQLGVNLPGGVGGGGCPIADMKVPTNVKLSPSDETKCLWGDDYNFGVTPGDLDKVLIYFNKGGACWKGNASTEAQMQCTPSIDFLPGNGGILNKTDDNPFKNFTMIRVKYCSGDVFSGNTTDASFNDKQVYFKGYNQARAVLDWVKANLPGELSKLVISGASAGSLGSGFWSSTLLREMSYASGYTMYDSYVGVFPLGTPSQIFNYWEGCKLPILSAAQQSNCQDADINAFLMENSVIEAIQDNPSVTFSQIESKYDATQISFYMGLAQSHGVSVPTGYLQYPNYYFLANGIMAKYNKNLNYFAMLIEGDHHVLTDPANVYFKADTAGPEGVGSGATGGLVSVLDFGRLLILDRESPACEGPVEENQVSAMDEAGYSLDKFCAANVVTKGSGF